MKNKEEELCPNYQHLYREKKLTSLNLNEYEYSTKKTIIKCMNNVKSKSIKENN